MTTHEQRSVVILTGEGVLKSRDIAASPEEMAESTHSDFGARFNTVRLLEQPYNAGSCDHGVMLSSQQDGEDSSSGGFAALGEELLASPCERQRMS